MMTMATSPYLRYDSTDKELWSQIISEATDVELNEPLMSTQLRWLILHPENLTFSEIVARTISYRLTMMGGGNNRTTTTASPTHLAMSENDVYTIFMTALQSPELEMDHTMEEAIRMDAIACIHRDPACETLLEVILFYKGYASLVCHRVARRIWKKEHASKKPTRFVSLWLQSQASAVFGVDIHPHAEIGSGVMLDHGTGVVIGETAKVGDHCTLLHNVTLGGTGKQSGDRHPKVGANVLIGAGASILGNIKIGNGAKIGAGSVVLQSIPHGATAVGSPARIVGSAIESRPGSVIDLSLMNVKPFGSRENFLSSYDVMNEAKDFLSTSDEVINETKEEKINMSSIEINMSVVEELDGEDVDEIVEHSHTFDDAYIWRGIDGTTAPPDAINFHHIRSLLLENGATEDEIGEVYFALLKKNPCLAYVPKCVFRDQIANLAEKYTHIKKRICDKVIK